MKLFAQHQIFYNLSSAVTGNQLACPCIQTGHIRIPAKDLAVAAHHVRRRIVVLITVLRQAHRSR